MKTKKWIALPIGKFSRPKGVKYSVKNTDVIILVDKSSASKERTVSIHMVKVRLKCSEQMKFVHLTIWINFVIVTFSIWFRFLTFGVFLISPSRPGRPSTQSSIWYWQERTGRFSKWSYFNLDVDKIYNTLATNLDYLWNLCRIEPKVLLFSLFQINQDILVQTVDQKQNQTIGLIKILNIIQTQ